MIDKNVPAVKKWFVKDPQFDLQIKERFEIDLIKAKKGEYRSWQGSLKGSLWLIILYDQFSRNLYRNTPQMYEADPLAREISLDLIRQKKDEGFSLVERIFIDMPLMHSEDIKDQEFSIKCFTALRDVAKLKSPQSSSYYEYTLRFAQSHHAIIKEFSRFPHRNHILGRESTLKEKEFLNKKGSSF